MRYSFRVFGVKEGTAVAASVAKAAARCDQTAKKAFASASDYVGLSDEHKCCVRSALNAEEPLGKARQGLAALIYNYTDFPLAFLVETAKSEEDGSRSELEDLREAIRRLCQSMTHTRYMNPWTIGM